MPLALYLLLEHCTLIRKSPRWCIFTQTWGFIVIASYLCVFNFGCAISQGFGLFSNKVYYHCMTYVLTIHVNELYKIKLTLKLFHQAKSLCKYTKVVWLWWYKPRYFFVMRVYPGWKHLQIKMDGLIDSPDLSIYEDKFICEDGLSLMGGRSARTTSSLICPAWNKIPSVNPSIFAGRRSGKISLTSTCILAHSTLLRRLYTCRRVHGLSSPIPSQ